ncbi:MAG: ABC transporter permease [Thermoplasmata archaeon]
MRRPRGSGNRLRHTRLQMVLTALGLAMAVALPVILISVGDGVASHELAQLESSAFQITVSAAGEHGIRDAHALARSIGAMPEVGAVSPVLSVPIDLFPPGGAAVPLLAEGVEPGPFVATLAPEEVALFPHPLPLGDPLDLTHWANGSYNGTASQELMVSSPIAHADHLSVGETVLLSAVPNRSAGESFTVTGTFGLPPALLGPTAAFAALVPLSDLQLLTGNGRSAGGASEDAADTVEVGLAGSAGTDPATVARIAAEIQADYPYYAVSTETQAIAQEEGAAAILQGFYWALSSVALAVGLLFLALVLVRRVEQRRTSIAVARALGQPAIQIARALAREAVLLAALGTALGFLFGAVAVGALALFGSPTVEEAARLAVFNISTLGLLAVVVGLLALAASLLATRAALRLPLAEILR